MKKKILTLIVFFVFSLVLVACKDKIDIKVDEDVLTLTVGDTYEITYQANDDVSFVSSNPTLMTVDETGKVTALQSGEVEIRIVSVKDETIFVSVIFTIQDQASVGATQTTVSLRVGKTHQLAVEANTAVTYTSSDETVLTVSSGGLVQALKVGEAQVTVRSTTDESAFVVITVTVQKAIVITVPETTLALNIGEEKNVVYEAEDSVRFESSNSSIFTVNSAGKVKGIGLGTATLTIISTVDATVSVTMTITVSGVPVGTSISITGENMQSFYQDNHLTATILPAGAPQTVIWESSDESIATITNDGIITPHKEGVVVFTVTSVQDETLTDSFTVEFYNALAVDPNHTGSVEYDNKTFNENVDLFKTIEDALDVALPGAKVYLMAGIYEEDLEIETEDIHLIGADNAVFKGKITQLANHTQISGIEFTGNASISSNEALSGFIFENNTIENITANTAFLTLVDVSSLNISNNILTNIQKEAIVINGFLAGDNLIFENELIGATTAFDLTIGTADHDVFTTLKIERNKIKDVITGIIIDTPVNNDLYIHVRFNEVENYSSHAAKTNANHGIDFTLNYWGKAHPTTTDFVNVTDYEFRGYYSTAADIVKKKDVKEGVPVKIITNDMDVELYFGDQYLVEAEMLPMGSTGRLRYITSNPAVVVIQGEGNIATLSSGQAIVSILLEGNFQVRAQIDFAVLVLDMIELTPDDVTQTLEAGDSFDLLAEVYPYLIEDEDVVFTTSDPAIATVVAYRNANQKMVGTVTSHQAGLVVITAALASDPTVIQTFTIEFYDELDSDNLLDLLTMNQVSYTTPHKFEAHGMGSPYAIFAYESVSRYYFGGYGSNNENAPTQSILPVNGWQRSGRLMSPIDESLPKYNDDNVYWVVVHDTGNNAQGSGALSHSNYLWNLVNADVGPYISWHFTMDDTLLYQHLPEIERAYHAGDGSTLPYKGSYLGGGNTNGISIETAVSYGYDIYRIWQRTAKLVATLLERYNLPREHMTFHQDFSGKLCPQTMIRSGLQPLFHQFADVEYEVATKHQDAEISFVSHNPEYVDQTGRVISLPQEALTVSYTVSVTVGGQETSRTFYTYLPGTDH